MASLLLARACLVQWACRVVVREGQLFGPLAAAVQQLLTQATCPERSVVSTAAGGCLDPIRLPEMQRERLSAVGKGPSVPIDSNNTEAGRKKNRRVELHIVDAPK